MNAAKTQFEVVTADNDRTAEDRAIAACEGKWGKCTTDMSGCSFSDGHHPPPAPRAIAWAAIAYSAPDMKEGHAQGKRDRASAEQEAMAMCQQHGHQCAIRATFNKQCGALAADGTVTGVGVAADQSASLQKALEDCRRAGGARCAPHVAFCSH